MLAQGENPKVVSERLGHKDITLTLDTYTHVLPTMQEAATQRLEDTLFGTDRKQSRGAIPRSGGHVVRVSASRASTVRAGSSKARD